MRFTLIYLFFSGLFFLSIQTIAQNRNFSFHHYGPEDGLSNTNVFAIKQDVNHVVYLATENGVYTFDGYVFRKIKPKSLLKSSDTRNIAFNSNNDLLIVNRREGIYNFNKRKNDITLIKTLQFNNLVDELILTNEYTYALQEPIAVTVLENSTGKLIEDEVKLNNNTNQAYSIFKTNSNVVLIGRTDGLYQFKNGKQQKINLNKQIAVYAIAQDKNGVLYLGSDDAIVCVKDEKIIKTISVKAKKQNNFFAMNNSVKVSRLIIDKYNRIWFTNKPDDNLYLIENNITYDAFDLLGIDKVIINSIFKDSDDNIWLGTYNDGVYFLQNPKFKNISFASDRKIVAASSAAYIEDNIVVGTDNGLFIFDNKTSNTQTAVLADDFFAEQIFGIYPRNNTVVYAKLNSISNTKRPFLINNTTYNFNPIAARLFYYSNNTDQAYMADGTGNLMSVKNYTNLEPSVIDTLISFSDYRTKINTLYKSDNSLFVGTSDGLSIYSFQTKNHKSYHNESFSYGINHIEYYNNKTYLAHENGITIFEDSVLIQQIGEQRLSAVKKIKFYNHKIWLATQDGLFICDEKFNPIVIYNKSNGLLSNTINDIIFKDSCCCICTNKGITLCNTSDLTNVLDKAGKLFISYIEVDGEEIDITNNTIKLKSSQSDIAINFQSPLFVKPNKQYYRYRLNLGKWQNIENTQVRLSAINGGKHQLDITCSYDGINWSAPLNVYITKDIPFKETIWFIVSIVLGSLFFIIVVALLLIKRVRTKATKRVQEDRQVNLLKHQAMNSLMSPHFIFNSLTSIQNYINSNDSLKASEYLAKFSRLIRMIIEKAAQSDIPLNEELQRLDYYLELEKERFKGKFDFFVEVDPELNPIDIKIPNMIIQPYAENAIIHGILPKLEHGNLYIKFKKSGTNHVLIIIEDDGIGFNKAKENAKAGHKSLGTKTIENILELNTKLTGKKQQVEIIDKSDLPEKGQGTRTIITIQL